MRLSGLQIDEFRDVLAEATKQQRRRDATTPPLRDGLPRYATLHYSGVPAGTYADRRESLERARVIAEARHHLTKNWGTLARPIYADRYMYDFCVLASGTILRTGADHELWHCRNTYGNAVSWSVHVLCDEGQDLTGPQRVSLFALFDALRHESGFGRDAVVGHCEWPRYTGEAEPVRRALPVPLPTYRPQLGQSACPGKRLHAHLAAYRALRDL
jgi:hypothetical protein